MLPFLMTMAELEGRDDIIHSRAARINAIKKEFQNIVGSSQSTDEITLYKICARHDIDYRSLSEKELEKILTK